MSFDFDRVIDRASSDSRKWRKYAGRDVLPLWVADMDFASPPAVIEALHRRVDHGVFGYSQALPPLVDTVLRYFVDHYGWRIEANWIVWLPGLVPALNLAARAFATPGDAILTATPIYPPFMSAPRNNGCETLGVALVPRADGRYEFDWAAMERAVTPRTKILYVCSPHNPVGRVFTRPELEQIAAFCLRHNLVLVSDDIHCDLILDDRPHVPLATLAPEIAARTVSLFAPSKTYNIAGLACAFAVIPDAKLRQQFTRTMPGIVPEMSPLAYAACEAALRDGEPWRQALLAYLRGNRDFLAAFLREQLPAITLTPCEATYLAWLDVTALGRKHPGAFFEEHGVGLADGAQYGAEPGRFVRLNFGCPRSILTDALHRMQRAVASR